MRCAVARRLVSARADDVLDAPRETDLVRHLDACGACRDFAERLAQVRRSLHLQPVGAAPDVAPRVRAALEARAVPVPGGAAPVSRSRQPGHDRRVLPAAAAAFLVAVVVAASVVGLVAPPGARATDVRSLVLAGQTELHALDARVEVVEYGWHPDVPTRTYTGELRYAAPETLALTLQDRTDYPSGAWRPNDVTLVVDDDRAWGSGLPPCPPAGLPACTPEQPRVRAVEGRAPFDPAAPVPLDLVLPVASFLIGGAEEPLGEARIDGRDMVGVAVTAAQIAPLLEALASHGNWRPIHPTDRAEVWLDAGSGLPLRVEVRAAGGYERDRWAAANGLDDLDGAAVLTWRLEPVSINGAVDVAVPEPPADVSARWLSFRDQPHAGPTPTWLPEGMTAHRTGRSEAAEVSSYADGRAWVAIHSASGWEARHLYGHAAGVVRRIELDGAGVAYVPEGGDRILLHGDDIDVEVVGSLPTEQLLRVASSLGVTGRPVPDDWREASTATLAEARAAWPGLLTLAQPTPGYAGPGVSVSDAGVVQSFAGAGDRGFVLIEVDGDTLGPPVDAVVLAVDVRDRQARFTPDRGTLEWVENGRIVTLRSRTLGLAALAELADGLRAGG